MRGINPEGVKMEIVEKLTSDLERVGVMFRVFSRSKTILSLQRKFDSDKEYGVSKKVQDLVGLRIVLYFPDDVDLVREIVSTSFSELSKDVSIDKVDDDEFRAVRYNIVYSLPADLVRVLNLGCEESRIDATFELQIRTIFSEGWHEIDHDFRYKCKSDWLGFNAKSRLLNGVYASLENNEWTMIKVFDELAYSHYKSRQWAAMLRQKLRLRFVENSIREEFLELLNSDTTLAKKLFRIDRYRLMLEMNKRGYSYPITLDNVVLFANMVFIENPNISALTPEIMVNEIMLLNE